MTTIADALEDIEEAKELVQQRDLALKLYNNHDFNKLIVKGFCTEECARFAQASGDSTLSKDQRDDLMGMAQAAGHLRRWLSRIITMGNGAEDRLPEMEDMLAAIRQELPEESE